MAIKNCLGKYSLAILLSGASDNGFLYKLNGIHFFASSLEFRSQSYSPLMHRCSSVEHLFFSLPNNHNGIETFTVGLLRCKTKLTYSNNIFILLSVCLMLIIAPMVKCERANDNDNAYNYRAMWFRATTAAKF